MCAYIFNILIITNSGILFVAWTHIPSTMLLLLVQWPKCFTSQCSCIITFFIWASFGADVSIIHLYGWYTPIISKLNNGDILSRCQLRHLYFLILGKMSFLCTGKLFWNPFCRQNVETYTWTVDLYSKLRCRFQWKMFAITNSNVTKMEFKWHNNNPVVALCTSLLVIYTNKKSWWIELRIQVD